MEKDENKDKQSKKKLIFSDISMKNILILSTITIITFGIIVYIIFSKTSIIPAGLRLTRADWLSFIGDYLSFAGTALVSIIALWQTKHYNELDENRREEDRKHTVQPVFSITLSGYTFDSLDEKNRHIELFANIITITHAGDYPISHVIVFNEYMKNMMTNRDSFSVLYAFEDLASKLEGRSVVTLTEDAFDRHEKHTDMPKHFNINYDDVDGRCMCQTFKLIEYGETVYYSLDGKPFEP